MHRNAIRGFVAISVLNCSQGISFRTSVDSFIFPPKFIFTLNLSTMEPPQLINIIIESFSPADDSTDDSTRTKQNINLRFKIVYTSANN